jgi:hypothetical protein
MTIAGFEIDRSVYPFVVAAAGLGLFVVLLALIRTVILYRDRRMIRRYLHSQEVVIQAPAGILSKCLRDILGSEPSRTTLSPDAVAILGTEALENASQALTDRLRFLSYTPLLLGLCGTVVGLMFLLRADPDAMQQHLAGVLIGTLSGVAASLVASVAVAWLEMNVLVTKRAASELLFSKLLPSLPEKKIAIAVEEHLLEIIAQRSHALVSDLSVMLTPLSKSLGDNAQRSAEASERTAKAFAVASEAAEKASVLRDVAGLLAQAASTAHLASDRLAADAKELVLLHVSETAAAEASRTASGRLATAAGTLMESVAALRDGVCDGPESLKAAVRLIGDEANDLTTNVSQVSTQIGTLNQEVIGLSTGINQFGARPLEALGKKLEGQVGQLVEIIRQQLEGTPGKTADALRHVGTTAENLSGNIGTASRSLEEFDKRVQALVVLVNKEIQSPTRHGTVSDPMGSSDTVQPGKPPSVNPSPGSDVHLAAILASIRELVTIQVEAARRRDRGPVKRALRFFRMSSREPL